MLTAAGKDPLFCISRLSVFRSPRSKLEHYQGQGQKNHILILDSTQRTKDIHYLFVPEMCSAYAPEIQPLLVHLHTYMLAVPPRNSRLLYLAFWMILTTHRNQFRLVSIMMHIVHN